MLEIVLFYILGLIISGICITIESRFQKWTFIAIS